MLALAFLVAPPQTRPTARVASQEVTELSGLAASRRHKGVLWGENDSGDSARVFAFRRDGSVVGQTKIAGATNVDWEDLAIEPGVKSDTLWIDDLGNNGNARRDLALYAVPEPRPGAAVSQPAVRYPVRYPDQTEFPPAKKSRRFDAEAIFVRDHKMYVLTKWRQYGLPGFGTALYRMDTRFTDRENVLTKLGEAERLDGWVTGADLSPDGRRLAVLVHLPVPSIWIFDATRGDRMLDFPLSRLRIPYTGQCEAIVWLSGTRLMVTNEPGDLFEYGLSSFGPVKSGSRQGGQTAAILEKRARSRLGRNKG